MTSLIFGNFCFDCYSYRFGLGLGLELRLGLRVSFFGFATKCLRARDVCQAFSNKQKILIDVTHFGNFYFDFVLVYYSYRLGLRLGLGSGF